MIGCWLLPGQQTSAMSFAWFVCLVLYELRTVRPSGIIVEIIDLLPFWLYKKQETKNLVVMVILQGSPVTALITAAPGDTQLLAAASEFKPAAASSCGLSDSDVHRILAHRRAYIKQQRAFDRACVGNEHAAFDPTQVLLSMPPFANAACLRNINCTVKLKMKSLPA